MLVILSNTLSSVTLHPLTITDILVCQYLLQQ